MANNIGHANLAKFINFAALVGPSSLFNYTDWHTLQWSIVNLLFVDNMCCWSNKMPWHISSQIKSFVFNLTYHNYYLTNYRYTGLQYNYYLMVKTSTVAFQIKSQYSCKLIYNKEIHNLTFFISARISSREPHIIYFRQIVLWSKYTKWNN